MLRRARSPGQEGPKRITWLRRQKLRRTISLWVGAGTKKPALSRVSIISTTLGRHMENCSGKIWGQSNIHQISTSIHIINGQQTLRGDSQFLLRTQQEVNSEVVEQGISPAAVSLKGETTIDVEQPEKENIDPTNDEKLVKKAKKTKKETRAEEVDDEDAASEAGSEDIDVVNESYLEEIAKFMEATDLGLIPDPPTKGDGNCWYRAAAEQVSNPSGALVDQQKILMD